MSAEVTAEVAAEIAAEILTKVVGGLKISGRTELDLNCSSGDP